jgi:hypothetical protein
MIAGLITAGGNSALWPISAIFIFASLVLVRQHIPKFDIWILFVIFPVSYSVLFAEHYAYGLLWSQIVFVYFITRHYHRISFLSLVPILGIILVHFGISLYEFSNGMVRPTGLTNNSSVLGMTGLGLFPFGGLIVGLSQSRTALLGIFIYTICRPSKLTVSMAIVAGFLFAFLTIFYQTDRSDPLSVLTSLNERSLINRGGIGIDCITGLKPQEQGTIPFKLSGYGYGNFCFETGRAVPHNIFILATYELGIMAVPFFLGLFMLWWKYSRSFFLLLLVATTGLFVQDIYSRIEGIFIVGGLILLDRYQIAILKPTLHKLRIACIVRRMVLVLKLQRQTAGTN